MKIHGFWDDPEGLSFPEAISIVFTALYLTVTGVLLSRLLKNALTDQALDFYQILTWTMLTVLGGWFGDRMLSRFGNSNLRSRPRARYQYEPTTWEPETPEDNGEERDGRATI